MMTTGYLGNFRRDRWRLIFKRGNAAIAGASAGVLIGSAFAGFYGAIATAVIIACANLMLNAYNDRHPIS